MTAITKTRLVVVVGVGLSLVFSTGPALAVVPAAEQYIFPDNPVALGPRNTDSQQHPLLGHNEYFIHNGGHYSNRGCDWGPNDRLTAVPYGYGHEDDTATFRQRIVDGLAAGNHSVHYGEWGDVGIETWSCGVDCTGFVCNIWGLAHTTTAQWATVAYRIPRWDVRNADSLLIPGHVVLYDSGDVDAAPGENLPWIYQAFPGGAGRSPQVEHVQQDVRNFTPYRQGQDNAAPVVTNVELAPVVISPNADGVNDVCNLAFTVTDAPCGAAKIEVEVNNQLAYTVPNDCRDGTRLPRRDGGYSQDFHWTWDGTINGVAEEDGEHLLEICAADLTGNRRCEVSPPVYVDATPPVVTAQFPTGDDVPMTTPELGFSLVDPQVNNYASGLDTLPVPVCSIDPPIAGDWTFTTTEQEIRASFSVLQPLQEGTTYTVNVLGAWDLAGNRMEPFSWQFTVEECGPCTEWNAEQRNCAPRDCGESGCWEWNTGGEVCTECVVCYCDPDTATCGSENTLECQRPPAGDHPDDTHSIDSTPDVLITNIDQRSSVGVLFKGNAEGVYLLLDEINRSARVVLPEDISGALARDVLVLIVPTAGLRGMGGSELLSARFAEYVEQGGNLFVLTQPNGADFSVLPGGLQGVGWNQDISCWFSSMGLDTYHQTLAGMSRALSDIPVDGYFTTVPQGGRVLLRRMANSRPGQVLYPYGDGWVGATGSFVDWGVFHGQAFGDAKKLLRDFVTWAEEPATLPEIGRGETVTYAVAVTNPSLTRSATGWLEILDPDQAAVWQEIALDGEVGPGGETEVQVSFTAPAGGPLGIWHTRYVLVDADGREITRQIGMDGRFAVSTPLQSAMARDIAVSVVSDKRLYAYGEEGEFAIEVSNNTGEDRDVHVWWSMPLHSAMTGDDIYGMPGSTRPYQTSSQHQIVHVPAAATEAIETAVPMLADDTLYAQYADESEYLLGIAFKSFHVGNQSEVASLAGRLFVQGGSFQSGDAVEVVLELQNKVSSEIWRRAEIKVFDPAGSIVLDEKHFFRLEAYDSGETQVPLQLDDPAPNGRYRVEAWVYETERSTRVAGLETDFHVNDEVVVRIVPQATPYLREEVPFSIEVTNLADEERAGEIKYYMPGHFLATNAPVYGGYSYESTGLSAGFVLPGNTAHTVVHAVTVITDDQLRVRYTDSTGVAIESNHDIGLVPYSVLLAGQADQESYVAGDEVEVEIALQNLLSMPADYDAEVSARDINRDVVYDTVLLFEQCPTGVLLTDRLSFVLPPDVPPGEVRISAVARNVFGEAAGSAVVACAADKPRFSLQPVLPHEWSTNNHVEFLVSNSSVVPGIASFSASLLDPSNTEVWQLSEEVIAPATGQHTVAGEIPLSIVERGIYHLVYELETAYGILTGSRPIAANLSLSWSAIEN